MRWVRLNLNELVVREDLGKQLSNFRNRPMVLLTLDITAFMCLSMLKICLISDPSLFVMKFVELVCLKKFIEHLILSILSLPLKKIGGCNTFLILQVKIISCACLDGPGLKLDFHWKTISFILSKFSESYLAVTFGSIIIISREVCCLQRILGLVEDFQ